MIKKKKTVLKRVFALLGVFVVLLTSVLPFGVGAVEQATQVNHFSFYPFESGEVWLSDKTTIEYVDIEYDTILLKTEKGSKEDGIMRYYIKLSDFMPFAKVGESYTLKMEIYNNVSGVGIVNGISVGYGSEDNPNPTWWSNGKTRTLTQQDLDGYVSFYGYNSRTGGVSSVDVYTYINIAIVPEGRDYVFDYVEEVREYKRGYHDGFVAGQDEAYDRALEYAYREYINRNTILNSYSSSVEFFWDASMYESDLNEGRYLYLSMPVYYTKMDNSDYEFDGYSFKCSELTDDAFNFDGVSIYGYTGSQYLRGLRGVSVCVTTKDFETGEYARAADLPISISFPAQNSTEMNDNFKAIIEYAIPVGYDVPEGSQLIGDYYLCRTYVPHSVIKDTGSNVWYSTAKGMMGLDDDTPVMNIRITMVHEGQDFFNMSLRAFGVSIVNAENNPAYMAGLSKGSSVGYKEGFVKGKEEGLELGRDDGYNEGLDDGEIIGFNKGYEKGLKNANEHTFRGLMFAVVDAPVQVFSSMLNFEVLGINLLGFLTSLLTIMIVVAVVKVVV